MARSSPPLPSDATIASLFEVAYHASFLTEETRRLAFRIIYLPRKDLGEALERRSEELSHYTPILFDEPRPFSVGEILRLAPATDLTKILICVEDNLDSPAGLHLWGLLDAGASWWKFATGESSGGMPPPDGLTLSSVEPGPSLPSLSETVTFRVVLSLEGEEETVCCRIGTGMEPTAVA
jgi:hypothetical protein